MPGRRLCTIVLAAVTRAALVATLVTAMAAPAAAHVSVSPAAAPAGGFARLALRVPHGCDGQATRVISTRIPDGVVSVVPQRLPGWEVTTESGAYDEPVELHGAQVREGVRLVTWTAQPGEELPDGQFLEFGLSVRLPEADGALALPTVQTCVDGSEAAWVEVAGAGEPEPEQPAPAVQLTAGHDHGQDRAAGAKTPAADAPSGPGGWTLAALVLAAGGALAGGAALVSVRRAGRGEDAR